MNPITKSAPIGARNTAGAIEPTNHQIGDSPMILQTQCKHCTVPTDGRDVCAFCASYTLPEPLTVDGLLAEVDTLLPTLLASRLASASQCFPAPDGGQVYVQSSGPRISIAVTERDPDTLQLVTREFTAELREVTR